MRLDDMVACSCTLSTREQRQADLRDMQSGQSNSILVTPGSVRHPVSKSKVKKNSGKLPVLAFSFHMHMHMCTLTCTHVTHTCTHTPHVICILTKYSRKVLYLCTVLNSLAVFLSFPPKCYSIRLVCVGLDGISHLER